MAKRDREPRAGIFSRSSDPDSGRGQTRRQVIAVGVFGFVSAVAGVTGIAPAWADKYPSWDDVKKAVKILHEANMVFGDLRTPNIMCVSTGTGRMRAMLVDFDWAGVHGRDRYPATMNSQLNEWAPGMVRDGVMLKDHDLGMLEKLLIHAS